jgi:hypothetical protein
LKYRRRGSSLALTLESKPVAMIYLDDEPKGRSTTITVGKGSISKVVFKQPSGSEFELMAKYTP